MTELRYRPVPSKFFEQATEDIAYQLLNLLLVRESADGVRVGRIVECEMYQGPHDKGAHSFGGVPTPRTAVMYGPAGHAYVYLIYGMYSCLNVVTEPLGTPHAILIRAVEPLDGLELMQARQKPTKNPPDFRRLAAGPGKLCRAFDIDRQLYGHPLWQPPLYLALPDQPWPPYQVARGPRINIAYAEEAVHFPWRFWVYGHPAVSGPKTTASTLEPGRGLAG